MNPFGKGSLDGRDPGAAAVYRGTELLGTGDAGRVYAGYFDYQFLDQESIFLPTRWELI